ncbi:hypothetical protein DYB32_007875 [Aphanomyces invadans]|uniref:ADP-ribosylation factor-like protein 2-binding protein n=1 Tax=Aphanomyces invadans TaxID=157072 RepID=A0A418AMQ8_9STRA|nr:hypothetical protein DYB32_007875 [Aphanomyces invadans]
MGAYFNERSIHSETARRTVAQVAAMSDLSGRKIAPCARDCCGSNSFLHIVENQPEIALCDDGDDELGEEEIISTDFHGGSTEENKLDEVMGVLQDVLIDPDFVQLQTDFCQKHCEYFDDASENKLIYMDLFKEYTLLIENYLEARLQAEIEDFSMDELCQMIQDHEGASFPRHRGLFRHHRRRYCGRRCGHPDELC